jgi:bacterioferritin-associated ferredoxin
MGPDDEVCLCFHVSLRKIRAYLKRENPPVASLISECLGAGTGCRWCVPILETLHRQHARGQEPALGVSSSEYAEGRRVYRETRARPNIPDENDPADGVGG